MAKILTKNQNKHNFHNTPVYKLWAGIVKRCENKNCDNYKYYGGRGIMVCEEWRNSPKAFCEWALNNGYEKGLQIDRINNNGNYEPLNCRFVTPLENCAPNKRKIFSTNKTGHSGIAISKHGTFEVYVTINRKQTYIGVRKTIMEALELKNNFIKSQTNEQHN